MTLPLDGPEPAKEDIKQHEPIWSHGWSRGFASGQGQAAKRIAVSIEDIDVAMVLAQAPSAADAVRLMRELAAETARAGGAGL